MQKSAEFMCLSKQIWLILSAQESAATQMAEVQAIDELCWSSRGLHAARYSDSILMKVLRAMHPAISAEHTYDGLTESPRVAPASQLLLWVPRRPAAKSVAKACRCLACRCMAKSGVQIILCSHLTSLDSRARLAPAQCTLSDRPLAHL